VEKLEINITEAMKTFTDERSILRCGFNAGPTTALRWTMACNPAANTSSLLETCIGHQIINYIISYLLVGQRQKLANY